MSITNKDFFLLFSGPIYQALLELLELQGLQIKFGLRKIITKFLNELKCKSTK